MRLTDLCKADSDTRLRRKAQTVYETIHRRMDYHRKHHTQDLGPGHVARAREISSLLEAEMQAETVGREISSSLTRRPILQTPVKQIMAYIYNGLPEPGPAQHTSLEQAMVDLMNSKGRDARAAQHKFNLMAEIAYRHSQGWYLIFNTLTVAPGKYYTVFAKDSKEWKNYVRAFDRLIQEAETGARNTKSRDTNHTYFAVIEEGGQNGRLHIHVVHMVRKLPIGTDDPNKGRIRPDRRTLDRLKRLWPHGKSEPIAVRYSPTDGYGLLGWRWPLKDGQPLQIKSPLALANYMSKYITKAYTCQKRAELLWRVRKTQKLGHAVLEELTSLLTPEQLKLLATDDTIKLTLNHSRIPPALLRLKSLQRYKDLQSSKKHSDLEPLHQIAKHVTPRDSLLHSLRGSTTAIHKNSQPNTGLSTISECLPADTYRSIRSAAQKAARFIDRKYYGRSLNGYGTASVRDHL